jgi:hypothetical protein
MCYLITVIDVFSKFAYAIPIKSKTAKATAKALDAVFAKRKPSVLQSDQGREFDNREMMEVLKRHGIQFITTRNTETKCGIVERFNRTLRSRMFKFFTAKGHHKYLNVLPRLLLSYNSTVHRSIGMAPRDVRQEHVPAIFKRLYGAENERELLRKRYGKPKLKVGDQVRLQYGKKAFEKGYYPTWTDEVYKVTGATKGDKKAQYALADWQGKKIEGRFYPEEVQKVLGDVKYRVEKILKEKRVGGRKQVYVKWVNFGPQFNSWIYADEVENVT